MTQPFILRRELCHITNAGVTTDNSNWPFSQTDNLSPSNFGHAVWTSREDDPRRVASRSLPSHSCSGEEGSSCDMQEAATTYTFPALLPPLESSPSDSSPVTELTRRRRSRRRRRTMKGKRARRGGHSICYIPLTPPLTLMDKLQSDTCILKHDC